MSRSFQHEKPPARINLFLEVAKGGAKKKMELPLRMLVMGDFLGREDDTPIEDREVTNVNKDNFANIMQSSDLGLQYAVADKLRGGDEEMKVDLKIKDMDSFSPDEIARQIPQLSKLLATRNLLQDLRNRLISMGDFRKQLESVIKDDAAREQLLSELSAVVGDAEDSDSEGGE